MGGASQSTKAVTVEDLSLRFQLGIYNSLSSSIIAHLLPFFSCLIVLEHLSKRTVMKTPLLLFSVVAACSPVLADTQFANDGTCDIKGDPDIYGIGIRIGYYLQWVATILAQVYCADSANTNRASTNIITFAVIIISIHGAATEGSLMLCEWYIVQYLVFWINVGNLPLTSRQLHKSTGSLSATLINYCLISGMNLWLYWRGINQGQKDGCDVKIFLFASFSAYDYHWTTFNKVVGVIGIIFTPFYLFGAVYLLGKGIGEWNGDEGDDERLSHSKKMYNIWLLMWSGAVGIAFVEKSIQVNHITFGTSSILDSGQLIALLIGALTILSVVWEIVQRFFSSEEFNII